MIEGTCFSASAFYFVKLVLKGTGWFTALRGGRKLSSLGFYSSVSVLARVLTLELSRDRARSAVNNLGGPIGLDCLGCADCLK